MFRLKKATIFIVLITVIVSMAVVCEAAQRWKPTRPIRLMVTSAPGGAYDAVARQMARTMPDYLAKGTKIIVQNVPGGAGLLGVDKLARSKPDGHTFMLMSLSTHAALAMKNPLKNFTASDLKIPVAVKADPYGIVCGLKGRCNSLDSILNAKQELRIAVAGTSFGIIPLVAFLQEKKIPYTVARFKGSGLAEVPLRTDDADLYIAAISAIGLRPYYDGASTPPLYILANERDPRYPDAPTHIELGMPAEWSSMRILRAFAFTRSVPDEPVAVITDALI